jgi:hypothetical protein
MFVRENAQGLIADLFADDFYSAAIRTAYAETPPTKADVSEHDARVRVYDVVLLGAGVTGFYELHRHYGFHFLRLCTPITQVTIRQAKAPVLA